MNDVKTLKFIEKSINVHGSKYDYSLVEYTNSQHKVKIVCPEHGAFEQIANNHIRGKGCSKCGNTAMKSKQSSTTESFINSSKRIHKSYDYSLVEYKNNRTKVEIICEKHGIFEQTPNDHLSGRGCPKCRYEKSSSALKSNNGEFINKATQKHGYMYDYKNVHYINAIEDVEIICPKHGIFWQKPNNHLNGSGCKQCGHEQSNYSKSMQFDEFIDNANSTHNWKYDYSSIKEFSSIQKKYIIVCPIHGEFEQTLSSHLNGRGCPKCAKNELLNTDEVVKRFKVVHGDMFDYNLVQYVSMHKLVDITCTKHGIFKQSPANHLAGKSCPKCSKHISKGELELLEFIKNVLIEKYKSLPEIVTNKSPTFFPNKQHLDIYIPDLKVGFEFNGVYWHSDKFGKGDEYHSNKSKWCSDAGVELIHIWEDDWKNDKENMKRMVRTGLWS